MKKITICLLVCLSIQNLQAQNLPSIVANPELWQKSKTQRTIGWVLLGGGAVTAVIGGAIASSNFWSDILDEKKQPTGSGAMIAGITMMAGSIPFFIMAANNRRASFTASNVPNLQMNNGQVFTTSRPQLSITLTQCF